MMFNCVKILIVLLGFGLGVRALPLNQSNFDDSHWITAWTAMPQLTEPANLPSGVFVGSVAFVADID